MAELTAVANKPVSLEGDHLAQPDLSLNSVTKYLCAAAHLRPSMMPNVITEPELLPRPPLPVGRGYAWRVFHGTARFVPMPAVNLDEVRRHCRHALIQTSVRDIVAAAAVVTSALLAPWPTLITAILIVVVIALAGRIRLRSPVVLAAAIGIAVALLYRPHGGDSFAVPLIAIAACFASFTADNVCARFRLRRLWRQTTTKVPASVADRNQVYYDKSSILGSGVPLTPVTLTVAVDKPAPDKSAAKRFRASELLEYIAGHVRAQGISGQLAAGLRSAGGDGWWRDGAFTYGLPNIEISEVVVTPLPRPRQRPVVMARPLITVDKVGRLSAGEVRVVANRAPSIHPDQHYVRAASTLWDGQIVAAIYVSAALEGHYLRVLIRPYTLLPIGPDLHVADGITDWHLALQLGAALSGTMRRFLATAANTRHPKRWRSQRGDARRGRPGELSPRELYALLNTPNMHQVEDLERIIQVMETKVFAVTEDFLKEHDIDIAEYASQVQNFIVNNVVGNTVTGGTVNVAAAGRNVAGSQRGAAPGQGGQQSEAKK